VAATPDAARPLDRVPGIQLTVVERVQRFLLSRRNFVGLAVAAVGVALNLVGVLTGPFWLTIVAGMYVLGVLLTPKERGPDVKLDPAADAASIRDGLDDLVRQVQFKVANDILARVKSIRKSILATLEGTPDRPAGDPTVYLIRRTALDYLPSALSAYVALPRIYAERRAVVNGRTPHDVLLEQLDLMDSRMREAADAMVNNDTERLVENGRFLADRFGTSALRLDGTDSAPAAEAAPAPAEAEPQAATTENDAGQAEQERVR
jgi:hypothetical protein